LRNITKFRMPLFKLFNHVLAGEEWAQTRLKAFSGETARLEFGQHFSLVFGIDQSGFIVRCMPEKLHSIAIIRFPDDTLIRLLNNRHTLFSAVKIAGSAEFAETLAFVFRNLRWDIEHDLSLFVGDIIARRACRSLVRFSRLNILVVGKLANTIADFLNNEEEKAGTANHDDINKYCREVDALRDDVACLQIRIERLGCR